MNIWAVGQHGNREPGLGDRDLLAAAQSLRSPYFYILPGTISECNATPIAFFLSFLSFLPLGFILKKFWVTEKLEEQNNEHSFTLCLD